MVMDKVYEFVYNSDTYESFAYTVSIHRTRKGAEMAMEHHRERVRKEYSENPYDILDTTWDFAQYWGVVETELMD